MFKKLFNHSCNLLILGTLCLMFSEVRCGKFQQKGPDPSVPAPKKTADRQLAAVPSDNNYVVRLVRLYPAAGETGVSPDAVRRIRKYLSRFLDADGQCKGEDHVSRAPAKTIRSS